MTQEIARCVEVWRELLNIVPHESRAFNSKLLIAQVLGHGLRVPPGFDDQPLVTINNHEAWSGEIANLLKDILEVENTLSWGYEPRRAQYAFPLHNLRYQPEQTTVEVKRELDAEHPRLSQVAQEVVPVDLQEVPRQAFSESALKEHGAVYYVAGAEPSFGGHEVQLWEHYQKARQIAGIDESLLNEDLREIVGRLHQVGPDCAIIR